MDTTLHGERISLRPLQYSDANALVQAAADGELWNLTVTIVPSTTTVDAYLKKRWTAGIPAQCCPSRSC